MEKLRLLFSQKKKDFFIYGLGQAFNLLSPLIIAPYIVSKCGEAGFGKVHLGFSLSLFLILVVDYAFDIKGTKMVSERRNDPEALRQLLFTTLVTKGVLFFVTVLLAAILIGFIPFFHNEAILFLFSMTIVLAQVFNPLWFLQGMEWFSMSSVLNILSKLTYVVLVLALVKRESDYVLVNLLLGLSGLVFNVGILLFVMKRMRFSVMLPQAQAVKAILRQDFSFCVSQLFLSARQLSPLLLTGFFLGYHTAGQYKILEQILTLFRTYVQVFLKFFYPALCYKMLDSVSAGLSLWKKYTFLNIVFVAMLLLGIFIFSTEVLAFFNASQATIEKLDDMVPILLLVCLMIAVSLPLEQLLFATSQNKPYIRITMFVTGVNIAIILCSITTFELYGILVSLIVSEVLFIALYYKFAFSYFKKHVKSIGI